jgi:NAD+ synthetase
MPPSTSASARQPGHEPEGDAPPAVARDGLLRSEFYRRQIVLGLRDYARRCGFADVVVGCSGGIDSALTLALAVEALGADHVHAITMPSVWSSEGSVSDSARLCQRLGLALHTHPIADLVAQYASGFASAFGTPLQGLALENVQARIRGTVLMEYSNQRGPLLLTTGNKSELSVGYCTLYGDTNGGLGLIGDLYKTEVFALARHLNAQAGAGSATATDTDDGTGNRAGVAGIGLSIGGGGGGRPRTGLRVEVAGQGEDFGFVQVADQAQAAVGVAVQRAVAHRQFGLVTCGQQQRAALVGIFHQHRAPDAGLHVLQRQPLQRCAEGAGKAAGVLRHQVGNGVGVQGKPQALAQPGRVAHRAL